MRMNMAESTQRIIVRRTLTGYYPQATQQVIDWVEQTVKGWKGHPTPFAWNGLRRRHWEQVQLRRPGGSGVPIAYGSLFAV
jgi:hypothetical protein